MNTAAAPVRRLTLLISLLLGAPAPAPAQVAGGVAGGGTTRDAVKNMVANYKLHGRVAAGQLLRVDVVDGLLDAQVSDDLPNQIDPVRVEVEGSAAVWVVRKRVLGAANAAFVTATRYDFDAPPAEFWNTSMSLRASYLTVSAQSGDNANGARLRLTQSSGTISLSCTSFTLGVQNIVFNASATSLRQLQAEHPEEVRLYLNPLLRGLTGRMLLRPGPGDVYRVFDSIAPDPSTARRLDELLVRLEADVYAERDRASKELAALGAPGVLAALRRAAAADLSPEARSWLDVFVAGHSAAAIADPAAARKDRSFLIDCLDDPDPAVRAAAKAALETLLGKPVAFDVTQPDAARTAAVEALRRKITSETRAATQPATAAAATRPVQ